jgi:hypothetical protein
MKHSNMPGFINLITVMIEVLRYNDMRNDRHPDIHISKIILEVDNMALGQVFSENFSCLLSVSFHHCPILGVHSSAAGAI